MATKSFYHYSNFSDTAKLRAKWTQPDSTPFNDYGGGVWNFYNPQSVEISEPPVPLSDTIIDGISYKRIKFMQESNGFILPQIGYFRCDKKGTMFQYFKTTSEKIGCPLTRFEGIPTEQVPRPSAVYILFISDMLTPDELKVFAAWEKNAKENPVLK